jgi:predicted nucleic acid-binding protein
MNVLTDACSLINLANAGALAPVLSLARCRLAVSPIVLSECNVDAAAQIAAAEADGLLSFVDDDDVPADRYLDLLGEHGLGAGETECIAIAEHESFVICCDDRRARRVAAQTLGEERVIGTLRLLRWCVEDAIITCDDAFSCFERMKEAGAFLPEMQHEFFCQ